MTAATSASRLSKCRKIDRSETPATSATCAMLGSISPDWTSTMMASTTASRLRSRRATRPSIPSARSGVSAMTMSPRSARGIGSQPDNITPANDCRSRSSVEQARATIVVEQPPRDGGTERRDAGRCITAVGPCARRVAAQHDVTVGRRQQALEHELVARVGPRRVRGRRQVAVAAELGQEPPLGLEYGAAAPVVDQAEPVPGVVIVRPGTRPPASLVRPAAASPKATAVAWPGRPDPVGRARPRPRRSRRTRRPAEAACRCCRAIRRR